MNEPFELTVPVTEQDSVTARVFSAASRKGAGVTCVLGHGAGANQLSGFMQQYAGGLAQRGLDAVTFNFIYTEQKRKVPDNKAKLELCYRKVIEAVIAEKKLKKNRLVIGGKSMGGRIASQLVAELVESRDPLAVRIAGLVFLGYPLHPPGNPAKLRTEHLKNISMPMLFVQGTRDSLGTPDEIRPFVKNLKAKIFPIENGDHSFKVPKTGPLSQVEVHDAIMDQIVSWAEAIVPKDK